MQDMLGFRDVSSRMRCTVSVRTGCRMREDEWKRFGPISYTYSAKAVGYLAEGVHFSTNGQSGGA